VITRLFITGAAIAGFAASAASAHVHKHHHLYHANYAAPAQPIRYDRVHDYLGASPRERSRMEMRAQADSGAWANTSASVQDTNFAAAPADARPAAPPRSIPGYTNGATDPGAAGLPPGAGSTNDAIGRTSPH
jgi:hypothetical protein